MTFIPAIAFGGFAGWTVLKRTQERQTAVLASTVEFKRDEDHFRANIGKINTAEQLVADRRLLKVALGAFGLDGDINNKFFIRKVLEDGTLDVGALANRLADKQYQKMSSTFGFGDFAVPATKISDFPDKIIAAYKTRQFELAVGTQNDDLRLALNTTRELSGIATRAGSSEDARWFSVLGNAPLRRVFEKALALPASLGALDLDRQLATFKAKAGVVFGDNSITQFSDPAKVEGLVRRFLLRSESDAFASQNSAGSSALQMLQQSAAAARARRTQT